MGIKLNDILSVPDRKQERDVSLECSTFDIRGNDCPVSSEGPLHLKLANRGHNRIAIDLQGSVHVKVPCDRCLTDVDEQIPLNVSRILDVSDDPDNEDMLDCSYIESNILDVDMLVYEEVVVSLPMKILCRENCKGICPVCGRNLNLGECGCDRRIPDPRMSDVLDIFNN